VAAFNAMLAFRCMGKCCTASIGCQSEGTPDREKNYVKSDGRGDLGSLRNFRIRPVLEGGR